MIEGEKNACVIYHLSLYLLVRENKEEINIGTLKKIEKKEILEHWGYSIEER